MSKILVTGASGFLGSVIVYHLEKQNHNLTTLGISESDNIYCNLAESIPVLDSEFDWIIHIAGKAHFIPRTDIEMQRMFDVNVRGTKNLCSALEKGSIPKVFIFISSVAVYGLDFGENITEDYPLNGTTPYALSKIQAEHFLSEWCTSNSVMLGIVRPSLIAGKNPPGNLGNMINGIKSGRYLSIGDGRTRKSVIMADDIVKIIPELAEKGGIYNICDNHHPSFLELETLIARQLGKKKPISIPYWTAKCIALVGDIIGERFPLNSLKLNKIVRPLTFSNEKAKKGLNWEPLDVLSSFKIQ